MSPGARRIQRPRAGERVCLLYDKVCREDILSHAYRVSRAARGARRASVTTRVPELLFSVMLRVFASPWCALLRDLRPLPCLPLTVR